MTPEEKAILVSIGSAHIERSLLSDVLRTTATAGPGAGGSSFFIRSGDRRVRLSINQASPLRVTAGGDGVVVLLDDKVITSGLLEPALCHCPDQAYVTISERCIYDCRFCPVPKLSGEIKTIEMVLRLIEEAFSRGSLRAISLTSGVAESPGKEVARTADIVRIIRDRFDLPVGVSVYPTETSSEILSAAGADEIKYNVETMDPAIFARSCPGLSLEFILTALEGAVDIFGKNHVFSNFIIGLGESDSCVRNGVMQLAERGVIPVLRPISASPLRAGEIVIDRPSPDRLLRLARMERDILIDNGLDTRVARTMCLPCTGCDITPFRDV
jgi:biotin synthase-related radical SAM superfamily protein